MNRIVIALWLGSGLAGCTKAVDKPVFKSHRLGGNLPALPGEQPGVTPAPNPNPNPNPNPTQPTPVVPGQPVVEQPPVNPPMVEPVPTDPNTKKVLSLTEGRLSIGPASPGCPDNAGDPGRSLGRYMSFEVLSADTKLSFSLSTLCGDLGKASFVTIYKAASLEQVHARKLPSNTVGGKTNIFENVALPEGRYVLAVEVGGSRLNDIPSIAIDGAELTGTKYIKIHGLSDF